jgi:hypothetical protein
MTESYPEHSKTRELAQKATEAGVSAIPVVGGPLAVAFVALMQVPLERRRARWLGQLAERIKALEADFAELQPGALADNEEFVSAVMLAARAADATHEEELREALVNAVINCALPGTPEADQRKIYLRLIEEFTPSHLRVLTFMRDPGQVFDAQGRPRPDYLSASRKQLLQDGMPELVGRDAFIEQIVRDLAAAGFTKASLSGMVSSAGLYQPIITDAGLEFLQFIANPAGPGE